MRDQERLRCRLVIVVRAVAGMSDDIARILEAADAGADGVATVIVESGPGNAFEAAAAESVIRLAHARNVAVLISGDARLARTLGADGVHLEWSRDVLERYGSARALLGQQAIVGADAGPSRHTAMLLGEAGADYVAFSASAKDQDADEARRQRLDLVAWWSDIFEPPVMAYAAGDAAEAADLAAAGADFVAMAAPSGDSASPAAEWMRAVQAALRRSITGI